MLLTSHHWKLLDTKTAAQSAAVFVRDETERKYPGMSAVSGNSPWIDRIIRGSDVSTTMDTVYNSWHEHTREHTK